MWKEVQRTRKKISPVLSLCRVQSRPSLTTVRLEVQDQSIGSTVSDPNVRSSLGSTATRSSPFGYFGRLLQVVDN